MHVSHYETKETLFRKKVTGVNLLATTTVVLFDPPPGPKFILLSAYLIIHQIGTNSDAPNITLTTTGSGGGATVAAVDTLVADLAVQRLAVVGNFVIDSDHPLTITIPDAAGGSTTFKVDVVLTLQKIVD